LDDDESWLYSLLLARVLLFLVALAQALALALGYVLLVLGNKRHGMNEMFCPRLAYILLPNLMVS
ncbi:hypothetical protein A2U01_0085933, partial [Trifolium medium]|nr:hypothetical protein [Trifolium medium]